MNDTSLCLRNIGCLVTCNDKQEILRDIDLIVSDGLIKSIGGSREDGIEEIDASDWIVFPGLINTHHHFFQAFIRNQPQFAWPNDVLTWISRIYPLFSKLTEPCFYHTALICMAELIKYGCTTAFDHQYCFPKHAGTRLVDRQIEAARLLGMRFVAGRGTNTLPASAGGNVPEQMIESTKTFLNDVERLVSLYHSNKLGAMEQIVVAPCQPVNCWPETFIESLGLARDKAIRLHTHLGEGESSVMAERYGKRTVDWMELQGLYGSDIWVAHAWELDAREITHLGELEIGVSHCPAPVFLVGEEITDLPTMMCNDMRIGLGVDGCASNDNSNLAECIRNAYLLQCLVAPQRGHRAPDPSDYLSLATRGGAALLGREDIGELSVGKCADLFAIRKDRLEMVGALEAPQAIPAKLGLSGPTALTMIDGRIVWRDGEFPGLDESKLAFEARVELSRVLDFRG